MPRTFARTGVLGDYFFIAHWFPKIGVLEDTGWNSHQFHAATEFFADFGVYDVSLTVPSGWIVGATGREQSRTDNRDGTTTHRYVQADVHDFAWTTSPDFVEMRRRVEVPRPRAWTCVCCSSRSTGTRPTGISTRLRARSRSSPEWFGPYPYGHLTIVDPGDHREPQRAGRGDRRHGVPDAHHGRHALVACRGGSIDPEDVVIHEVGHQFWHGVVGHQRVRARVDGRGPRRRTRRAG